MEIETVLVPVDDSEHALRAVEFASAVATRYGAALHALHVLDEQAVWALEQGHLDEDAVADDYREFMDHVAEVVADEVPLTHSTAYGFVPTRLSHHPGSVILDAVEEVDADFLVVPREPVTGDPGEVLEKAAQYVLAYASQPVLSV